jgi:hypothetical protein
MALLSRVALHQTRLRVPGIGLDARGAALGASGAVLFPTVDRLVAFLAVLSEQPIAQSMADSFRLEVTRSKLGLREVLAVFEAGSVERMDRVAEVARLTGGFAFTGTSRHYVQYRDHEAPFGYDANELVPSELPYALYHSTFTQTYGVERTRTLPEFLLRLMPQALGSSSLEGEGRAWLTAEPGLGRVLVRYLLRSRVSARVGMVRADAALGEAYLFELERLPRRMQGLLSATPGLSTFVEVAEGALVELGYRHPVRLASLPPLAPNGLVLFRGRGLPALHVERTPVLAPVDALVQPGALEGELARAEARELTPQLLELPLRFAQSSLASEEVHALWIPDDELPTLRRLLYVCPRSLLVSIRAAFTPRGALLLSESGLECLPVGVRMSRLHPRVYAPVGARPSPFVDGDAVYAAYGSPSGCLVILDWQACARVLRESDLVKLEHALLQAEHWVAEDTSEIERLTSETLPTVWLDEDEPPLAELPGVE